MTRRSRLLTGAALLAGFGFVAAPSATPADLPKDAVKAAVPADVAALQKRLEDLGKETDQYKIKNIARTARGLSLCLIVYGDDATKSQAAKVLAGLKGKEFKAGIEAGKGLTSPKADPAALKAIEGTFDLDDVMSPFKLSARAFGMNIEKDIRDGIKAGKIEAKDAVLIGARSAALAEYTVKMPNDKAKTNPRETAKWERWAGDMAKAGKELCETAGKNDAKAMLAALKKLDASCSNCHNDFRNE